MGKAAFWFPTLSQISRTELLLSLQDVVRYATWCPQGVTLGYGNLWAFSPPLLACNSVLSSVCSVCSVDPCDLLLVGTKSIQKPRKRSVNFSQAFQLFQFQLCFRGSGLRRCCPIRGVSTPTNGYNAKQGRTANNDKLWRAESLMASLAQGNALRTWCSISNYVL